MHSCKAVGDPPHGLADLSERKVKTIDTAVHQRLRGIRQLSHAYLVYPTAARTRFEHSPGVAHAAGMMCRRLGIDGRHLETSPVQSELNIGSGDIVAARLRAPYTMWDTAIPAPP